MHNLLKAIIFSGKMTIRTRFIETLYDRGMFSLDGFFSPVNFHIYSGGFIWKQERNV